MLSGFSSTTGLLIFISGYFFSYLGLTLLSFSGEGALEVFLLGGGDYDIFGFDGETNYFLDKPGFTTLIFNF